MDIVFRLIYLPFVFLFGAAVGSFLNVVIYRLPARLSLFYPPSRCPHCHHALGKTENVPILGWLWLKGKCRWCRTPISPRYPLIEAMTALLFCGVFWQWGWTTTTLSYWLLVAWLSVLAWIDLDTFILPGILTKWGLILGLGFQGILGWQAGSLPLGLMEGIGSAVLGMWLFEILRWGGTLALGQTAMGGGDPKLAAMIGAWVGWKLLLLSSFLACGVGAVGGGFAIAIGWMSRKQPFPFGPYLALGTLVAIFWGDRLIELYLRSFFPVL
jgi:leader peptidase (prepilin peptidase)/N-methyltransferase